MLRIEVFAIVKDMLDRGERPVQSCVQKMLSSDSIRAFQELQHLAGGDDPGDPVRFLEVPGVFGNDVVGFGRHCAFVDTVVFLVT